MKNIFLSQQSSFDKLYPLVVHLPGFIRKQIACYTSWYLRHRLRKKGLPELLTLFVTDRCNLQCSHCFISTGDREKGWEMGTSEYEIFFSKAHGIFSKISFTGGEPTIRKDLGDIIAIASRSGGINSGNLMTNGVLRDNLIGAVERAFAESSISLSFQISIDGANSHHDTRRGVKGALGKTLETMNALRELKCKYPNRVNRLLVNTSISKQNLHDLPAIIDAVRATKFLHIFNFVRSSRIHTFNVSDAQVVSDYVPVNFNDYLSVREMEEALRIIYECVWCHDSEKMTYATNCVALTTIIDIMKTEMPLHRCFSGLGDIVLLPNGDVARCEMLKSFINLKEFNWNIAQMLNSSKSRSYYKNTNRCWCTHDCSLALSIMYDKNLLNKLLAGCDAVTDSSNRK